MSDSHSPAWCRRAGLRRCHPLTDDVRKLYAQGLGVGAEEVQPPQHYAPLDIWFAQLRDPDGYTVLLTQRHE